MHLYRHYKGGLYLTLSERGTEEATLKPLVVYVSLKNFRIWTRPAEDFFGLVDVDVLRNPRSPPRVSRFKKLL